MRSFSPLTALLLLGGLCAGPAAFAQSTDTMAHTTKKSHQHSSMSHDTMAHDTMAHDTMAHDTMAGPAVAHSTSRKSELPQ